MKTLDRFLKAVEVAAPTTFANLTVFPLLGGNGRTPDYATLDEALAQGWAEIREISEAGSVPQLSFVNRGDRAVFMLDGEELIGAKQNRVLNLTILAPSGTTLVIPVSCVEQGRWSRRSGPFSSSRQALYAEARRMKMEFVSASLAQGTGRRSDQSALWSSIGRKARCMEAMSPTGAMDHIYERHSRRIDDYVGAFPAIDGQIGAIFAIGERIIGMDLFESPGTLRKLLGKVVRSYALDAIDGEEDGRTPTTDAAAEFFAAVGEANTTAFPAVGLGQDVRISGNGVTGGALVLDERLVHLSAFRTDPEVAGPPESGGIGHLIRSSLRRRR